MKRCVFILSGVVLAGALFFCLWIVFRTDDVEWHKRAWLTESQEIVRQQAGGRTHVTVRDQLMHALGRHRDAYERMLDHERSLFELGYLTNHDFFVSNQVMTRAFRSNFLWRVQTRFGTNGECIWLLRGSTNHNGYHATLPIKDIAEWERIFRECATDYASNIPPILSTNGASP